MQWAGGPPSSQIEETFELKPGRSKRTTMLRKQPLLNNPPPKNKLKIKPKGFNSASPRGPVLAEVIRKAVFRRGVPKMLGQKLAIRSSPACIQTPINPKPTAHYPFSM